MRDLYETIRDPDAVLVLEPEELGGLVLRLLRKRFDGSRPQKDKFNPGTLIGEATRDGDATRGQSGYSPAPPRRSS